MLFVTVCLLAKILLCFDLWDNESLVCKASLGLTVKNEFVLPDAIDDGP